MALPTLGEATVTTGYRPGTAIGNTTHSLGDSSANSTYDDLLAIWDAYNGTGIGVDQTSIYGTPPGWYNSSYWSSTPSTYGHATVAQTNGLVYNDLDTSYGFVALEVL